MTPTQRKALSLLSGSHWHDIKQFPFQFRVYTALSDQGLIEFTRFHNVIWGDDYETGGYVAEIKQAVWLVRLKEAME